MRIAGQTAGPIGLKVFVDTHELPGGYFFQVKKKNFNIFFDTTCSRSSKISNINKYIDLRFPQLWRVELLKMQNFKLIPSV